MCNPWLLYNQELSPLPAVACGLLLTYLLRCCSLAWHCSEQCGPGRFLRHRPLCGGLRARPCCVTYHCWPWTLSPQLVSSSVSHGGDAAMRPQGAQTRHPPCIAARRGASELTGLAGPLLCLALPSLNWEEGPGREALSSKSEVLPVHFEQESMAVGRGLGPLHE